MKSVRKIILIIIGGIIFSCSREKEKEIKQEKRPKNLIILRPQQMDLMDIELGEIKESVITPVVYANGRIISNPESQASISSLIGGKVEKIYFKEGDLVKKNQIIASVSSIELINYQQEFYETLSELTFAKAELNRQNELAKQKIGAKAELQLAEAKYNSLHYKLISLKSKLAMLGVYPKTDTLFESISSVYHLVSPINGKISKLNIHLGKQLQQNEIAATVVNAEKLRAEIYCFERDISLIREGMNIEIEFANLNIPKVIGKVESIAQNVDEDTKAIKVYVSFEQPSGYVILPQMSIYVKIENKLANKKVKTVPLTAIYEEDNINYIFHTTGEKSDGKELYFKKSKVVVLSNDGNNAEIMLSEELPPATKIVIHNTFAMEIESRKAGL
jgi:cobalt-zinc-cadmium efflux system membrane fusion protein